MVEVVGKESPCSVVRSGLSAGFRHFRSPVRSVGRVQTLGPWRANWPPPGALPLVLASLRRSATTRVSRRPKPAAGASRHGISFAIATAAMERLSFDASEPWAYATAPSLINWLADQSERRSAIKTISHYLIKIVGPPGNKVILEREDEIVANRKGDGTLTSSKLFELRAASSLARL